MSDLSEDDDDGPPPLLALGSGSEYQNDDEGHGKLWTVVRGNFILGFSRDGHIEIVEVGDS